MACATIVYGSFGFLGFGFGCQPGRLGPLGPSRKQYLGRLRPVSGRLARPGV